MSQQRKRDPVLRLLRGEDLDSCRRRHGITLRQSHTRVSTRARREIAKLIHRGRHREAERKVSRMGI